ncbi:unnamed protein product [Schistosoma margrebowiei]|uniref:Uncharacterized protein n=1 Tax=Schistosoma margrebowiei TaxID=48269 RepID=A0A3P8EHH6_9TREM|nr:unnamed protein product [Schistosoma margrebowiei]
MLQSLAFRLVSTRPPISEYKGDIMPAVSFFLM